MLHKTIREQTVSLIAETTQIESCTLKDRILRIEYAVFNAKELHVNQETRESYRGNYLNILA